MWCLKGDRARGRGGRAGREAAAGIRSCPAHHRDTEGTENSKGFVGVLFTIKRFSVNLCASVSLW